MISRERVKDIHHLGYERVYLPLHKVADTPFHIQGTTKLPDNQSPFR